MWMNPFARSLGTPTQSRRGFLRASALAAGGACLPASFGFAAQPGQAKRKPITPKEVIRLFNGKDLAGFYPWLQDTKYEDPKKVCSVRNGNIVISGEVPGYLGTRDEYENYRLVVEYKWGAKTYGAKTVRNSGLLLHAIGPDGNPSPWASSIECQVAQGCVGDLIVIRGKNPDGSAVPVTITSDTVMGPDGNTRWKKGGKPTGYSGKQFWWSQHDPDFKELIDTRGKNDVESPLAEWTKVECVCKGNRITAIVNNVTVNECYDVYPSAGRILLESEGFEILFRKFELHPV
jgi:hypothetical protein